MTKIGSLIIYKKVMPINNSGESETKLFTMLIKREKLAKTTIYDYYDFLLSLNDIIQYILKTNLVQIGQSLSRL